MIDRLRRDDQQPGEGELLRRIRRGDADGYADIVRRHQQAVARIVGRRVPGDRVDEIVQDVFVRAYFGLAQFSGGVPFERWLAGIAVRACYDFWRNRSREDVPVSALTDDHQRWMDQILSVRSEREFHAQVRRREAVEVLDWALSRLSPPNRAVLTLVHLEGRSVKEAAELLGWSVVTVKVRAHRARRALRALLSEHMRGTHDDGT
jgi:RNA polymerase sigma-70 factor (ECF subfamily)